MGSAVIFVHKPTSIPRAIIFWARVAATEIASSVRYSYFRMPLSSTSRKSSTFSICVDSKVLTISSPVLALAFQLIVFMGSVTVYSRIEA